MSDPAHASDAFAAALEQMRAAIVAESREWGG